MKAFVYILEDQNGKYYIGSTRYLERRIKQHQLKATGFTSGMKSPRLVLSQEFDSITTARKIELRIKKLKRKDYIRRMVNDGFIRLRPR
jgi:putative endonuclease